MKAETMWKNYLAKLPEKERTGKTYTAWPFGADPDMARELADLVIAGEKTATASLHAMYELDGDPLPEIGEYNVITDWEGEAKVVTETIDVRVLPFKEVSPEFAAKEGEGDKSLDYWRREHIRFFKNELAETDKDFNEDMLVVCEEFTVVYP
ncbi:ASCH domain-containing protein [Lentibacillus sediminis]|uniref:ASCH domain-containing protein n=1 Tax=Lentibacillus sediminis TaxID=1940529 RepID=UPI000C1C3FA5|nr:ASCH domain-containing protein [Lentibacillus sediminis]